MIELRRISSLPPYAFAEIERLKLELRRAGDDVIDLGFGNPDIPSPAIAVEKLAEAAAKPRNHRYSASRGIPKLREAVCGLYARRFGIELDADREAIATIGAKEGLAHLLWLLVEPGDVALVPAPSYPIHLFAPVLAGASVAQVAMGAGEDVFANLEEAYDRSRPRPRALIVSFPHNPTTMCVDRDFFVKLVDFAREHRLMVVHDFAYADFTFDGYTAPSFLEVPGARDVGVEIFSTSKSYNMAGWRLGFVCGNARMISALARIKSYLDYGAFQPIQIAGIVALEADQKCVAEIVDVHRKRRDVLVDGLNKLGWSVSKPKGTMFVWAPIPEAFRSLGSLEFSKLLIQEAKVAVSPGIGFGEYGEGYVRFALVENEQRIRQALRGLKHLSR